MQMEASIDQSDVIYAWDANLLDGLDLQQYGFEFDGEFNPTKPEKDIVIRPLSNKDFDKGFTDVLNQLTKLGEVSKADFLSRFDAMKTTGGYYTLVAEDTKADHGKGKIIGTGTLEVEQKFIHSCALRGRVEELVIDKHYRGKKLGKLILALITVLSKKLSCYKTTLECKVEHIGFYGIFGYKEDPEKFMQLRFRD